GTHFPPDGRLHDFQPISTGEQPMDVRIESFPQTRVAFMRHVGPYDQVGQTWSRFMSWAWPKGLVGPRTRILGIVHDDPEVTPRDCVRYDACIAVDDRFKPEGEVGVQEVGGGEYAIATHQGPYDDLSESYARLCGQWLPASGRELRSAPALEVY